MSRAPNWPALLTRFIEEKRDVPFDWANNNCCFFAADWCLILTGIDPAADIRADVKDKATAAAMITPLGGLAGIADARCVSNGWPEVPRKQAQRGDVVLFDGEHGETLGVCAGPQIVAPGPSGLMQLPMSAAKKAWRIR